MSLYTDVTVPVPATAGDEFFHKLPPFVATEKNEGRNRWRWRFDTAEKYQEYMKNYYRLATEVDATCGRVLAELEAQGVRGETLVIFTTDNGYFHAEHGLADKWYPHQESIRVPLIIRDPRMAAAKAGTTNEDFTLNADLAPTILAATGVSAPATMQGRDIAPLYLAAKPPVWRTEFFYEHAIIKNSNFIPASEALVRKDAKFMLWPDFQYEELFDLRADPGETKNVVAEKKEIADQMRRRFVELKAAAR